MGLTIHYKACFGKKAFLEDLIEETEDIANAYGWCSHIIRSEFPAVKPCKIKPRSGLTGISIVPPDCEPVFLTFLSDGKLMCHWEWEYCYIKGDHEETLYYGASVKEWRKLQKLF